MKHRVLFYIGIFSVLVQVLAGPHMAAGEELLEYARPGRGLQFPQDHGSHPRFSTEWWYYTGQLYDEGKTPFVDRPRYGFQLAFFRHSEPRCTGQVSEKGKSCAGAEKRIGPSVYLAHAALSSFDSGKFVSRSRLVSGALGVGGAATDFLRVWNQDWEAQMIADTHVLSLSVMTGDIVRELRLLGEGDVILHGEKGYSRKGGCEQCASMYYSTGPLSLRGTLIVSGTPQPVRGIGWMDHEFMSEAIPETQAGWDWYNLLFADGRSLMLFDVRGINGERDFSAGTLRTRDGNLSLAGKDFLVSPAEWWTSPESKARYPVAWKVELPAHGISEIVRARIPNQEVIPQSGHGPTYWEGAVATENEKVLGYIEMTGYDKPIGGTF